MQEKKILMKPEAEVYKRIRKLGEGSFGKVYLVRCLNSNTLCAIKQIDINEQTDEEKKKTVNEAKILESLKHPNIINFREVYKTKKGRLCIVMDYADGFIYDKQKKLIIIFIGKKVEIWEKRSKKLELRMFISMKIRFWTGSLRYVLH